MFYAGFTNKDYAKQQGEIVISRGIDPFGERFTTGILIKDVIDLTIINNLRAKLRIGFWNKNNWDNLAETLPVVESGIFLYRIGQTKLGIEKLKNALKDEYPDVRRRAADSLGSLGKANKTVIEALLLALKDEDSDVLERAADPLGIP